MLISLCLYILVPGSLTLKKEHIRKRSYAKRKVITVPELLSERAELASQSQEQQNDVHVVTKEENEDFEEFLILDNQKPIESNTFIDVKNGIEPQSDGIEILNDKMLSPPSNNTISYSIPKSSVLVLTPDGNYVIASLENDMKTGNEIRIPPPQLEQIIILNSGDIQFAEMEVEQTANDKG